jgi:hypothetical protein
MDIEREEQLAPRGETLTRTCAFCRRPRTACEPVDADLPACKRCALDILPRLIAQAVLADSETGYPLHDGMDAIAVVRRNYCFAVMYYSRYYDRLYGASRYGEGEDDHLPGWEGPDDDDDFDEVGFATECEVFSRDPGGVAGPTLGAR